MMTPKSVTPEAPAQAAPLPLLPAISQFAPRPTVERLQTLEDLVEALRRLSLAEHMTEILGMVSREARQLTGADGASLVLREGDACVYAAEDAIAPLWKGQRFPLASCVGGWVIHHRQMAAIPDIQKDERTPVEFYRTTFVRSLAMVPIRSREPIGALGSFWARPHQPTAEEIKLLQALADSAAVAIENIRIREEMEERVRQRTVQLEALNEKLRGEAILRKQMEAKILQLSLTDDLTGLTNRRGFLFRAEQLLKLVNRVQTYGWLVYVDLDGLKQVNDALGHEAGDRLIRSAAKVLRESFRDSDVIGRIGGDEFVVFATGSSTPAGEIEDRVRRNLEHHNNCFPDQPKLSMSVGLVRCDPHAPHSLEDMIHQADAAMYIQKRRKREQRREAGEL